ncbi:MAG: hypothetical protein MI747_06105 [Desulfobacterales bacterium]|nr:hypothetical protein [Desulfobacterales bacterium]
MVHNELPPLCKCSITCHTNDLAVFHCLNALSRYSESTTYGSREFPLVEERDWRNTGNKLTLWFTHPQYRDRFEENALRLLPHDLWSVVEKHDR